MSQQHVLHWETWEVIQCKFSMHEDWSEGFQNELLHDNLHVYDMLYVSKEG